MAVLFILGNDRSGEFEEGEVSYYADTLTRAYPNLSSALITRLVFTYGKNTERILNKANTEKDLGFDFGNTLFESEVTYLKTAEWAKSVDDVLWRRTLLGLVMTAEQTKTLKKFMEDQ